MARLDAGMAPRAKHDNPAFQFEVVARVETLKLDEQLQYVLQGRLGLVGQDGEPQMFALAVPFDLWQSTDCGDVLVFPLA